MKTILLCVSFFAVVGIAVLACGPHYPHDPVICTSDADCATGQQCLPEWSQTDGGTQCVSTSKSCKKPCTADTDCSYCGAFGVCAKESCDPSGPSTCGSFCGTGK